MIVTAIFGLVQGIVNVVLGMLPTATVTFPDLTTVIGGIGQTVYGWDFFLPISDFINVASIWITIVLPAIVTYKVANWIWRHIPDVGGFGPGAG